MTIQGVDYAWERPDPKALYEQGIRFVCRYISYDLTGKNITRDELAALHGAGLAVVLNWEFIAGAALSGEIQGRRDALEAARQASELGWPDGKPIYFSIDFDAQPGQMGQVLDYIRGAASVLGASRVGVYGGLRTIHAAADAGLCGWLWQTYGWSRGVWDERAHIRQTLNGVTRAGVVIDLDEAMTADYGQWDPPLANDTTGGVMQWTNPDATHPATGDRDPDTLLIDLWSGEQRADSALAPGMQTRRQQQLAHMQSILESLVAQGIAGGSRLAALETKLDGLATGGVDLDALADKIISRLLGRLAAEIQSLLPER